MKLDAIGIVSSDLKKSIEFYKLLGLNFIESENSERHIEATTESGLRVMLDSEELMKEIKPNWVKPSGQRITLAFSCESPTNVDEIFSLLISNGFKSETSPWNAFWGQRYATVLDPDGNAVDLFADIK